VMSPVPSLTPKGAGDKIKTDRRDARMLARLHRAGELTTRQQAIAKEHRHRIREISWRCQNRLHERGRKLAARGKTRQKMQIALARELAAFVWEVMCITTPLADGSHAILTPRRERTAISPEPAAKKKSRDYTLKVKTK
jgi:hypothetical protein